MSFVDVQSTNPPMGSQAASEDLNWGLDLTAQLSGGSPTNVVAVLTSVPTGMVVSLSDGPGTVGNVVSQRIRAGVLAVGSTYQLTIHFQPSGGSNTLEVYLTIFCNRA